MAAHRTIAGRYRLDGLLGRGGRGDVHTATDVLLGCEVAVKLLPPRRNAGDIARFRCEAEALTRLDHPGIVRVLDAGVDDDLPYIVMDLVHGRPLAEVLADGRLTTDRTAHLAAQLAEALVHAHERGVVHRDVKPSNVLVEPGDRVWLTDFGTAALPDTARVPVTGQLLRSAAYIAPEQVRGEDVGPPADVYALGLLITEALTGRRPFPGTPIESALARLQREAVVTDDLPAAWRGPLRAMTRRDPAARPSAADVRAWLEAPGVVALQDPLTAAAEQVPPAPPRRHVAVRAGRGRDRAHRWHRRSATALTSLATASALIAVTVSTGHIEALVRPLRQVIAPPAATAPADPEVLEAAALVVSPAGLGGSQGNAGGVYGDDLAASFAGRVAISRPAVPVTDGWLGARLDEARRVALREDAGTVDDTDRLSARPGSAQPGGDRPDSERPENERPENERPENERPENERPGGDPPVAEQPPPVAPPDDRPPTGRPPVARPDPRPADPDTPEERPREDRPVDERPAAERPEGERPAVGRPAAERPDGERPAEGESSPAPAPARVDGKPVHSVRAPAARPQPAVETPRPQSAPAEGSAGPGAAQAAPTSSQGGSPAP